MKESSDTKVSRKSQIKQRRRRNCEEIKQKSLWIKLSCRYNYKTFAENKNEDFLKAIWVLVKRFMIYLHNLRGFGFITYSKQVALKTFHDFVELKNLMAMNPQKISRLLIDVVVEQSDVNWIFLRNNYTQTSAVKKTEKNRSLA